MDEKKVYNECSDPVEEEVGCCWSKKVPARAVLYLLSWSGFLVSFMMRNDINLTIVAMVKPRPVNITTNMTKEVCYYNLDENGTTNLAGYNGTIDWSNSVQSYIIAAFFWAYILSQIVGGIATQKFGTKAVFGYSQLITALGSLSIPWATDFHYSAVIGVRFIQGFASGLTWPAMYAAVIHWVPIQERTTFMSSFQGFSIGIGLTYPLCGFLIAHFGWRSVFYTTGSLGVIWCVIWYFLAFDSPESHPRISKREAEYIRNHTEYNAVDSKKQVVPWKAIILSKPVWSIAITTFGRIWIHYVFIIMGPLYMKNILHFSIEKNGLLNGAPFLLSYLATVMFCYVADKALTSKFMSLITCRKIMTLLSQVVPGVLILSLTYFGCNIFLILIVWFFAVVLITASYAGAMANIVDISPNFAGPVLAFAQTIHMSASFISPMVSFSLLEGKEYLISGWKNVFYLSTLVALVTYVFYQLWGSAEIQDWDKQSNGDAEEGAEDEAMLVERKASLVFGSMQKL